MKHQNYVCWLVPPLPHLDINLFLEAVPGMFLLPVSVICTPARCYMCMCVCVVTPLPGLLLLYFIDPLLYSVYFFLFWHRAAYCVKLCGIHVCCIINSVLLACPPFAVLLWSSCTLKHINYVTFFISLLYSQNWTNLWVTNHYAPKQCTLNFVFLWTMRSYALKWASIE